MCHVNDKDLIDVGDEADFGPLLVAVVKGPYVIQIYPWHPGDCGGLTVCQAVEIYTRTHTYEWRESELWKDKSRWQK